MILLPSTKKRNSNIHLFQSVVWLYYVNINDYFVTLISKNTILSYKKTKFNNILIKKKKTKIVIILYRVRNNSNIITILFRPITANWERDVVFNFNKIIGAMLRVSYYFSNKTV